MLNGKNFVSPGFLEYYPDINIKKKMNLFTNGIDKIFIENRLRLVNGAKTFSKSMRIVDATSKKVWAQHKR